MRIDAIRSHTLHTEFTYLRRELILQRNEFIQLTVELSARLEIDDRPVLAVLSFGDDAGVAVECKYGQSDLVHAPAKRQGGWMYKHSAP